MRTGTILFTYFNTGDLVLTPYGYGRVWEDEEEGITTELEFLYSKVKIQHMMGYFENPHNLPVYIERRHLLNVDSTKPALELQGIHVEDYFNALVE